ncbi:MAG: TRAP transporter small permease [Candidatus Rokubacteria bacterium]|nr:TRAP transporter small permease [Candidatus Rokubacteria bacterium]
MTGEPRPPRRWGSRLYDGLGHLGGAILALMAGAVFVQVVLRYVFARAIDGIDEVPRHPFVWLVMIGAAAAMHRGQHTALDYFRDRMGFTARRVTLLITNALVALLLLSMIKVSLVLVPNAQLQRSAGLDLPLGWVFLAVPVGSALILGPMVWTILKTLRELWQRRS